MQDIRLVHTENLERAENVGKRSFQLGMENTGCIRLHHEYTPGAFRNGLLRQRCQLI